MVRSFERTEPDTGPHAFSSSFIPAISQSLQPSVGSSSNSGGRPPPAAALNDEGPDLAAFSVQEQAERLSKMDAAAGE